MRRRFSPTDASSGFVITEPPIRGVAVDVDERLASDDSSYINGIELFVYGGSAQI